MLEVGNRRGDWGSSDSLNLMKLFYFQTRVIDQIIQMLGSPYLPERGESGEKKTVFPCLFWYGAACCVQEWCEALTD